MRDENKLRAPQFGPGTRVAVAQFDEINWPVELGAPRGSVDSGDLAINLHKRSRTQKRIHRVIVAPDIPVLAVAYVQALNERDRHLSPNFHHSGNQAGLLEAETAIESDREGDRLILVAGSDGREMRVIERQRRLQAGSVAQQYAKHGQQLGEIHAIQDAQGE